MTDKCRYEQTIAITREDIKEIKSDLKMILQDISALKVKAGFWGAIGGAIPIAIGLIVWFLRGVV